MPASMKRWIRCGIGAVAATLVGLAGCKKGGDEGDKNDIPKPPVQVEAKKDNNGKTLLAQSVALEKAPQLLSFKDAVILDPPPEGESRPPNKTHTGKNAVKIFGTKSTLPPMTAGVSNTERSWRPSWAISI
jgi:hypothetical protein